MGMAVVMTLDELMHTPTGTIIWEEWQKDEDGMEVCFTPTEVNGFRRGADLETIMLTSDGWVALGVYGSAWRAWTSKPTAEQRVKTPWRDESD